MVDKRLQLLGATLTVNEGVVIFFRDFVKLDLFYGSFGLDDDLEVLHELPFILPEKSDKKRK